MLLRPRALPAGFIAPCHPSPAPQPPTGERWLHETNLLRARIMLISGPDSEVSRRYEIVLHSSQVLLAVSAE
jgi:hypothetical protein